MSRDIDALTSYTLKHLRDRWWTARWTHWVGSHLRCDPGERLVHVGCGNGEIDVALPWRRQACRWCRSTFSGIARDTPANWPER